MHFTSALVFAVSALQFSPVFAAGDCPSSLSTYTAARNTCSKYYPVKTVTVSVTGSPSLTKPIDHEAVVTPKPSTTSSGGKRTITSIVERTVTDCRSAIDFSTCKIALPTDIGSIPIVGPILGDFGLDRREAAPEASPEPFVLGNLLGREPALSWMGIVAQGPAAVESVCACIQGPAKTITVTTAPKSSGY